MKTVYEALAPDLKRNYRKIVLDAMAKQGTPLTTNDGGLTWTNPQDSDVIWQSPSTPTVVGTKFNSVITDSGTSTSASWNMESRQDKWKKCLNKTVIDIGVIANGACVTFDDSSMLEIKPSNDTTHLIDKSDLNLLNGTQLDDIVVVPHYSMVSDWVGNLVIFGKNGAQVVFKIFSPQPLQNFYFELKDLNAIR